MKAHDMELVLFKQNGETVWSSLLDVPERYDITPLIGRNIEKFPFFDAFNGKPALVLYNLDAMLPNDNATKEFHKFFKERYDAIPSSVIRGDVLVLTGDPLELQEVRWEL